jgi:FdhE protein
MPSTNPAKEYDARIRRAEHLSSVCPFAQEVLHFYRRIAEFQKKSGETVFKNIVRVRNQQNPESLVADETLQKLLPGFSEFLGLVAESGPASLALSAKQRSVEPIEILAEILRSYWNAGHSTDDPDSAFLQFLPRAFLQPLAEIAPSESLPHSKSMASGSRCPLCGARPLLGVLRPEGDGGKRFLLCSFCLKEWEFRRILCSTCGEESESKLPVFVAEQFPHIRVEACDTCKFYLRTVNLTKDGNAVPIVDDLAAIPLSLWANEQNYTRAQPNLLGT